MYSSGLAYPSKLGALCLLLCVGARADDAPPAVPQENFLSSLKQAFKQDFDDAVVRGRFDVGSPPDAHRYYCLVDAKSGKKQANGVSGELASRRDGMTGIKVSAVSLYDCDSAERQGILVTADYSLTPALRAAIARAAPAAVPPAVPVAGSPPGPAPGAVVMIAPAATPTTPAPGQVDVAGVRLGMSPDEVRALLRSKQLLDYFEAADSLTHPAASGGGTSGGGNGSSGSGQDAGRFVSVIAAWTPAVPAAGDGPATGAESFEVMFTPVPGKERVMAIVHSKGYAPADAPHASVLAAALAMKYGGATGANDSSATPTWRLQSDGSVQVGDACGRRVMVSGLGSLTMPPSPKANAALKTTPDAFRYQIERCGITLVAADETLLDSNPAHGDPRVSRFAVTAYSPAIAFEGSTSASQWMQAGRGLRTGKAGAHEAAAAHGDMEVPAL